jgi:hypothetical protein
VLTLTTYADYIPEVDTEKPLPKPVAAAPDTGNVVNLHRSTAGRHGGLSQITYDPSPWYHRCPQSLRAMPRPWSHSQSISQSIGR